MANLLSKYDPNTYQILKPFAFKEEIGVAYNKDIEITDLKKVMSIYEIENGRLTENGNRVETGFNQFAYYQVTTENIPTILKQIDYKIDDHFIIELSTNTYWIGYYVN